MRNNQNAFCHPSVKYKFLWFFHPYHYSINWNIVFPLDYLCFCFQNILHWYPIFIVVFFMFHLKVMKALVDKTYSIESYKSHQLHPKDPLTPSTVDWIFLIDTLNFSFWSKPDKYYKVTYQNETFTGYWSLCAAVNRAIEVFYWLYYLSTLIL